MDRDNRWERIKVAYDAVKRTISKGERDSPLEPPIVPLIPEIDFINVILIYYSQNYTIKFFLCLGLLSLLLIL